MTVFGSKGDADHSSSSQVKHFGVGALLAADTDVNASLGLPRSFRPKDDERHV